jgi:carbamoyl-phosphate synthase large subunit
MRNSYNVLIVPAGSGMAVAAIQMLRRRRGVKIVAADANNLASGLYLSHKGYLVPSFDSPSFYSALKKIIRKENINVLIPALDTVLLNFSQRKEEFNKLGVEVLVSNPQTIKITRDKWKTYNKLKGIVPLPKSFIKKEDIDIGFPLIIKPRSGSGSKDVYKLESKSELDFFYKKISKPIIQEYLCGKEYTVDCLADKNGNLLLCIPRERIETKAGISVKGKIVKNRKLEDMAKKVSECIKFFGPFFFQAKEDKNGIPKLTEINPRISGTMSLSSSSGPNIYNLAIKICMGEKVKIPKIKYGLYITRYWKDIYLTTEKKQLEEIN